MINYSLKYTTSTIIWQLHIILLICYSNISSNISDIKFQLQIKLINSLHNLNLSMFISFHFALIK